METLKGKVALITGAASGIGRETALLFAQQGARIAAFDRDEAGLASLGRQAPAISTHVLDLAEVQTLDTAVQSALTAHERIDFLLNIAAYRPRPDKVLSAEIGEWERTMRVNLIAPAVLTKLAAAHMIARGGGGRIINVSSSSAFRAAGDPPAGYACSKAAIAALTRVSAAELGPHDINVNTVAPGATRTAMAVAAGMSEKLEAIVKDGPLANLLGRVSEPEDVAQVILFLCRPESRQITGQTIHTSAGLVV